MKASLTFRYFASILKTLTSVKCTLCNLNSINENLANHLEAVVSVSSHFHFELTKTVTFWMLSEIIVGTQTITNIINNTRPSFKWGIYNFTQYTAPKFELCFVCLDCEFSVTSNGTELLRICLMCLFAPVAWTCWCLDTNWKSAFMVFENIIIGFGRLDIIWNQI